MFNIGIVGLGDNGTMHLRGFSRLKETRVAAICDLKEDLRDRAMELLDDDSVVVTDSYEELCSMEEIDAVCVSVPTDFHLPVAFCAMDHGKDLFLEKPLAPTIEDTDRLIMKVFETGAVVQVGLVYRYSNLYRTLAEMVERGDLGDVMMTWCKEYRDNFPVQWFFETARSGGALLDKDCHHFDLFSWFVRSRPEKVYAMGGQHVVKGEEIKINCSYAPDPELILKNPDILDHAYVLVKYANGALGNLGLCMYQVEPKCGLEVGVIGNNGSHAIADKDIILKAGGGPLGEVAEVQVDYQSDNHGIGHIGADAQHVEFVQCMKERRLPYANVLMARESMVICLAAERSVVEEREVLISEFDNPEINKLIEEHPDWLLDQSPAPLPPPRKKRARKPSREKEIINTFIDLVRLLSGKRPRGEALPFDRSVFEDAIANLQTNKKYLKMAKGLNTAVAFEYPEKSPVYVSLKDGVPEVISEGWGLDETKIVFTPEGWQQLQTGDSIQKLLFTRKVRVEGKIDHLKPYTDAFVELSKAIGG